MVGGLETSLDDDVVALLSSMDNAHATDLFTQVEEQGANIRDPNAFVKDAARRLGYNVNATTQSGWSGAGSGPVVVAPPGGNAIDKKVFWLNTNVFTENPIDEEAISALSALGFKDAISILTDVEGKGYSVQNPSNYIKAGVRRRMAPEQQIAVFGIGGGNPGKAGKGKGKGGPGADIVDDGTPADPKVVQNRIVSLNGQFFPDRPIDVQAIDALVHLSAAKASSLLDDVESKGAGVKNPTKYLLTAAARAGYQGYTPSDTTYEWNEVVRKAMSLNQTTFVDRKIDAQAIQFLTTLGWQRASELFDDVERIADLISNPGEYLKMEGGAGGGEGTLQAPGQLSGGTYEPQVPQPMQNQSSMQAIEPAPSPMQPMQSAPAQGFSQEMQPPAPTQQIQSQPPMSAMERAMQAHGIEPKPSRKRAEAQAQAQAQSVEPVQQQQFQTQGQPAATEGEPESETSQLKKRAAFLNLHFFSACPINAESILEIMEIGFDRAMALFAEIEKQAGVLDDPNEYLKAAVQREKSTAQLEGQPAAKLARIN